MLLTYSKSFASEYNLKSYQLNQELSKLGIKLDIKEDSISRRVIVVDKYGNQSIAVYSKLTNTLTVDGRVIEISSSNNDEENITNYSKGYEYVKTNVYRINVAGMTVAGIVAAIVASAGAGVAISVLSSVITSFLSDIVIRKYVSIKVHYYWDPSNINQPRPRYITKTELYSGYDFNRLLLKW